MLSPLRNRFGIPGVISVIALVFAMLGGAYAANDNSGGDATASAKAKKAKKGPRGPKGPKGDTGPAGPAGSAGPAGPKGDAGAAGSNGSNGSNGTSATATTFAGSKGACSAGGVEVKSASGTSLVCNGTNGTNGTNGPPGPPGAFSTESLPSGETLTGVWEASGEIEGGSPENPDGLESVALTAISFPIEVSPAPTGVLQAGVGGAFGFTLMDEEIGADAEFATHCPGDAEEPKAEPGFLCIHMSDAVEATFLFESEAYEPASSYGVTVPFAIYGHPGEHYVRGTWAVTAE